MRRYARAGIPHYWILAPGTHTLEAYRLAGAEYQLTGSHGEADVFEPELFAGLAIPIKGLFA